MIDRLNRYQRCNLTEAKKMMLETALYTTLCSSNSGFIVFIIASIADISLSTLYTVPKVKKGPTVGTYRDLELKLLMRLKRNPSCLINIRYAV